MKTYRIYEAFQNEGGGIEGCGCGWNYKAAKTAEEAAKEYWDNTYGNADPMPGTVIVATDDECDSYHFYPEAS